MSSNVYVLTSLSLINCLQLQRTPQLRKKAIKKKKGKKSQLKTSLPNITTKPIK